MKCQAALCCWVKEKGAAGLDALLAEEAEEAKPEFLRDRPKYYYYNQCAPLASSQAQRASVNALHRCHSTCTCLPSDDYDCASYSRQHICAQLGVVV